MDFEKRSFFRSFRIIGIFIDIGLTSMSWRFNTLSIFPQIKWETIAIYGILIFCILLSLHVIVLEKERAEMIPNVQIDGNPIVKTDWVMAGGFDNNNRDEVHTSPNATLIQVKFSNNPKTRTERNHAKNVWAKIKYESLKEDVSGNWGDPNVLDFSADVEKITRVNILSDGKTKTLNLAIKLPEHASWFIWREDRFFYPFLKGWDSGYKLNDGITNVVVTLLGERIEKKFKFRLRLGKGEGDTKVEILSDKKLQK